MAYDTDNGLAQVNRKGISPRSASGYNQIAPTHAIAGTVTVKLNHF